MSSVIDIETASDAELMEAAKTQIVSEDRAVIDYQVVDGFVCVGGAEALDAKGKPLRRRPTCQLTCQGCKRNQVDAPTEVRVRFEPALGRRMYWNGLALSFGESSALRCKECRRGR